MTHIEDFARQIPTTLLERSGSVFYSGRGSFARPSSLYVLGLNPGGNPEEMAADTVAHHTEKVLSQDVENWSAYRDESWDRGKPPGESRTQRRILHLFDRLDLDPGEVPCSNLVFLRTPGVGDLKRDLDRLTEECWAFHQEVIETLGVKMVLCFGQDAGQRVCRRVGAHTQVAEFREQYPDRSWASRVYEGELTVVEVTHPGRANWTNPVADPSQLVIDAWRRVSPQ